MCGTDEAKVGAVSAGRGPVTVSHRSHLLVDTFKLLAVNNGGDLV